MCEELLERSSLERYYGFFALIEWVTLSEIPTNERVICADESVLFFPVDTRIESILDNREQICVGETIERPFVVLQRVSCPEEWEVKAAVEPLAVVRDQQIITRSQLFGSEFSYTFQQASLSLMGTELDLRLERRGQLGFDVSGVDFTATSVQEDSIAER
ncbi:hypothetical protein [Halovenus marina]|uniref:hypothetical protein n=1 Tax=Halovenus marina TaxID=3396621 RepID=UPI003F55CA98